MTTDAKREIKLTKRLQKLMKRYDVELREEPTPVTHQTYQTTEDIPPVVFAAYEIHLKANLLTCAVYDDVGGIMWHSKLMAESGMPIVEDKPQLSADTLLEDYRYTYKLIADAGFYGDLLD